jgi:hypothetical protein
MSEKELNQKVAEEICNTRRLNGHEFHLGEWVALLDGKVVTTAASIDAVYQTLRNLDPDPHRGMILKVGPQVDIIR